MDKIEKQLLLKDLCARLPYLVKGLYQWKGNALFDRELTGILYDELSLSLNSTEDSSFKPYLRSLSSMTDEEKEELKSATCPEGTGYFDEQYLICPMNHFGEHISYDFMSNILNWLDAHHFDYRELIDKGLALEAPEGMYKTE